MHGSGQVVLPQRQVWSPDLNVFHRGTSLIKTAPPYDPTEGLCLGPYGGPGGWKVSNERGTLVCEHLFDSSGPKPRIFKLNHLLRPQGLDVCNGESMSRLRQENPALR